MWEIGINEFLYNPDSKFGIIFECIGEAPALIPFCYLAIVVFGIAFRKWGFRERKWELILFSCYLICVVALSATVVESLKHLMGRARFLELSPPDYLGYTPFYRISSFGGRSFPSGHASMSTLSFLLLDLNEQHKIFKNKWLLTSFCTIFTILVAFSRLVMGAHFITDLLAGIIISLTTRLIVKKIHSLIARKSL